MTNLYIIGKYVEGNSIPSLLEVKIRRKQLGKLESSKYLGVTFDGNLRWDKHIESLLIIKTK